jgi:hypothetical protein
MMQSVRVAHLVRDPRPIEPWRCRIDPEDDVRSNRTPVHREVVDGQNAAIVIQV